MNDKHKPPSAAEIEALQSMVARRKDIIASAAREVERGGVLSALEQDALTLCNALPRLLAMLTPPATNRCQRCGGVEPHGMDCPCSFQPPADAAVREAVEYLNDFRHSLLTTVGPEFTARIDTLLSYVRAVQAKANNTIEEK